MSDCAWCGKPAVDTMEIEPAIKAGKVTKRAAITAAVCSRHRDVVEQGRRDREARELEKRMRRARSGTGAIR